MNKELDLAGDFGLFRQCNNNILHWLLVS